MNMELYRIIQCDLISPNAIKKIGPHFIIQQNNSPKHRAKANRKLFMEKRWDILAKSFT